MILMTSSMLRERDQQALDDVVALLGLAELEPGPPGDDLDLVVEVVLE